MRRNQTLCFGEVHRFLDSLFDGNLHAKRILSLTNATLGVIKTASLAVNTIGQGLAPLRLSASLIPSVAAGVGASTVTSFERSWRCKFPVRPSGV